MSRQYEQDSTLVEGLVPVGDSFSDQIFSSNPPEFILIQNRDTLPMRRGSFVARHASGNGIIPAKADTVAHGAVGIAAEDIAVGALGRVQLSGIFVMQDWTSMVGQRLLIALGTYWLDTTAGNMTGVEPVAPGNIHQQLGLALSGFALLLNIGAASTVVAPLTIGVIVTYFQQNLPMVYAGAGAPEGVQSAFYGSIYDRDDGTVYRKSSAGYGNTGWNQLL